MVVGLEPIRFPSPSGAAHAIVEQHDPLVAGWQSSQQRAPLASRTAARGCQPDHPYRWASRLVESLRRCPLVTPYCIAVRAAHRRLEIGGLVGEHVEVAAGGENVFPGVIGKFAPVNPPNRAPETTALRFPPVRDETW